MTRWFALLCVLFAGCALVSGKLESPRVSLVGLQPIAMELFEQRYQVRLRVKNPNTVELPIEGIDFRLDINGQTFADGVSSQSVVIPAYGEGVIQLELSSSLLQVFRQLQSLEHSQSPGLEYRINGTVLVGGRGGRLRFDNSGSLQLGTASYSGT